MKEFLYYALSFQICSLLILVSSITLRCFPIPLEEWNSTEVFYETYINKSNPYSVTPPPWLIPQRPHRKPDGLKTHRHEYYDADGFQHMVTYSNFWKWPKYIYYINRWEPINFDVPLRRWVGGQRKIDTWETEENAYYFINNTATSRSVWVSPDDQQIDYDTYHTNYRGNWVWNDSMIFGYVNDTAKHIPADFMEKKRKQRGSIQGRWDRHFLVPSKAYWWGLPRNKGRLLS